MIVVDASAALLALLRDGTARRVLGEQQLHCPHLIDPEVAGALRRRTSAGQLDPDGGRDLLAAWQQLAVLRYPAVGLLARVWELRENVTAYDACYVALAESLGCGLLTADARLARAPGLRCSVTVVPD